MLYSLAINLFMVCYFIYIIPHFLLDFFYDFPNEIHQLSLYLSCNLSPSFTLVRNIASQFLLFTLICYMIYCKIIRPIHIKWNRKQKIF